MKTNITKIGATLLAVGLCVWSTQAFAQTTAATTVTTTRGAFTEYVPGSETMVVRTEANPTPLRYTVTKQTTIVDESGAPVAIERISPGSQLSVQYTGTDDQLVASRIVVQRPAAVSAPVTTTTAPVTTAPVTTAPVTQQDTTTTTTTNRPLTHHEKHELKEEREHRKKAAKEQIEHEKDALDKAKDRLDDDE
jgi:hypothetical protein